MSALPIHFARRYGRTLWSFFVDSRRLQLERNGPSTDAGTLSGLGFAVCSMAIATTAYAALLPWPPAFETPEIWYIAGPAKVLLYEPLITATVAVWIAQVLLVRFLFFITRQPATLRATVNGVAYVSGVSLLSTTILLTAYFGVSNLNAIRPWSEIAAKSLLYPFGFAMIYWLGRQLARTFALRIWKATLLVFFANLAAGSVIYTDLMPVRSWSVPSGSMYPALEVGDHVMSNNWALHWREPRRGEIIIFTFGPNNISYIKRIVALPGDSVQMIGGRLYINQERVSRTFLHRESIAVGPGAGESSIEVDRYLETLPDGPSFEIVEFSDDNMLDDTGAYRVPADHYFVLGDNRDNSVDSRLNIGFVPLAHINSVAYRRFFPLSRPTSIDGRGSG